MKCRITLVGALVIGASLSAEAKDLYVNNSGNPACSDSTSYAANDSAHPWCTIGRAAWGSLDPNGHNPGEAAQAGDTILVSAGNYTTIGPRTVCGGGARFAVALNPANNGTSAAPITFRGIGTVNIYLAAGYAGPTIGAQWRNYIVWDNVRIDEQTAQGVSCADTGPVVFNASQGPKVLNSTIRGTYRAWGDNYNAIRTEAVRDAVFANNTIYDITGNHGHNVAAWMLYDTSNTVFEHNRVFNSNVAIYVKGDHSGDGWPQQDITIRFNWFENLSNKALFVFDGANTMIYQNVIKSSPFGIRLCVNASTSATTRIVNNTLIDTDAYPTPAGLSTYCAVPTGGNFHNNIVYGSWSEAINFGDVGGVGGMTFEHNIYHGFDTFGSVAGAQISFATWKSNLNRDSASPAGVVADPLFAGTSFPGGYKLQSGSPARTLGVDLLDLDRDGSATDVIPAGAYVTGTEVIGPTSGGGSTPPPPPSPAAPAGVRIM